MIGSGLRSIGFETKNLEKLFHYAGRYAAVLLYL